MTRKNRKVTIPVSIGYGLTDIMGGGAFTVIGAWLLFFYTTFVGLSPIEAASIVAIARIVDAIVSLFMGSFTDHFYKNYLGKKFGRRRFFLLIGAPLMLVYTLLWLNGMNYWFYLAVYLAFEIIAAMVLIPWETLPSEMTKDFNSRTKLSTCRMFLSASGTFLATFIPGLLIGALGENNADAYLVNGVVFAVMFMVCVFISWKVTWERELTPEMLAEMEKERKSTTAAEKLVAFGNLFKEYASTLKVRAFRKHLAIYLFSFTAKDVYNTVFVFFCVYCLNVSSSLAGTLLNLLPLGFNDLMHGYFRTLCVGYGLYAVGNTVLLILLYFTDYLGAVLAAAVFAASTTAFTLLSLLFNTAFYGFGFLAGAALFYLVALFRLDAFTANLPYRVLGQQPIVAETKEHLFTRLGIFLEKQDAKTARQTIRRENRSHE